MDEVTAEASDPERRSAQRQTEHRLSRAFYVSPIGNLLVRVRDQTIIDINDAYLEIFGYERADVIGQPASTLTFEPAGAIRLATASAFARDRGFSGLEVDFVRKDGTRGQGLVGNHPLRADGELFGLGTLIDITERKSIEQSLRDSQARLQAAIEAGAMGTWIWEIPKREIWLDDAAIRLLGQEPGPTRSFSSAELIGFVLPEDRERVAAAIEEFRRTGRDSAPEFRTHRPDGKVQWLISRGHVEYDEQDRAVRMAGVFVDITERKRTEESQLRSRKMEALGTLAGGIAHDFNNILLAISGNTRLAMTDLPANHPAHTSLREVDRASARAVDLVRRILMFSRQQEARREVIQLQPIIEEALSLLRPTLPAMIDVSTAFAATPAVLADPTEIHQIIVNLTTNAAHAIGQRDGLIEVTVDAVEISRESARDSADLLQGSYARLSVSDSGSGMNAATLGQIFDPFFTTKSIGEGTGLGLSMVHGIVKSCGGAINVYSQVGKGTTFRLYFPAAEQPGAADDVAGKTAEHGEGEHILYVDDEESLVYLARRMLERVGYRVTGCTDPRQAVELFRGNPLQFNAVVTDLSMRGMSGFELARAILEIREDAPVIMTSGYMRPEDRETATRCGIREFILKPDTMEDLAAALARALRANAD